MIQDDVLLWSNRVIIPSPGRQILLEQLRQTHPGIVRMKSLARTIIWWPKMDANNESRVRSCDKYKVDRHAPARAPLHPWMLTDRLLSRLHIDYCGPISEEMLLVVVNS